jgi:hypothetical protein
MATQHEYSNPNYRHYEFLGRRSDVCRYILKAKWKICVLENEFGEVSVTTVSVRCVCVVDLLISVFQILYFRIQIYK